MPPAETAPRFLCLGGAVIDRKLVARQSIRTGTSNPADGSVGFGGVARNVAENLARLGGKVALVSCVGADGAGAAMLSHLAALGVDVSDVETVQGQSTAEYVAILEPDGGLHVGMADMRVLDHIYGPLLARALSRAAGVQWLFADCNAPAATLELILRQAAERGLMLAVDAISTAKAMRLPRDLSGLSCLFLNRDEAEAMLGAPGRPVDLTAELMRRGASRVVLTLGAGGAIACDRHGAVHVPAEATCVADVTGAGDANIAGTLHGLANGLPLEAAARLGAHLAARTVASPLSVDAALSPAVADAFIAGLTRADRRGQLQAAP